MTHSLRSPSVTASPTTNATCVPSGDGTTAGTRFTVSIRSGVHDGGRLRGRREHVDRQGRREGRGGDRANQQHSHTSSEHSGRDCAEYRRADASRDHREKHRERTAAADASDAWPIAESACFPLGQLAQNLRRADRRSARTRRRTRGPVLAHGVGVSAASPSPPPSPQPVAVFLASGLLMGAAAGVLLRPEDAPVTACPRRVRRGLGDGRVDRVAPLGPLDRGRGVPARRVHRARAGRPGGPGGARPGAGGAGRRRSGRPGRRAARRRRAVGLRRHLHARRAARRRAGRWVPMRGGVRLTIAGIDTPAARHAWRAGRLVRVTATLRRPLPYRNFGTPDQELRLAWRGTRLFGAVKSASLVEVLARGSPLAEATAAARAWARRTVASAIGPDDPQGDGDRPRGAHRRSRRPVAGHRSAHAAGRHLPRAGDLGRQHRRARRDRPRDRRPPRPRAAAARGRRARRARALCRCRRRRRLGRPRDAGRGGLPVGARARPAHAGDQRRRRHGRADRRGVAAGGGRRRLLADGARVDGDPVARRAVRAVAGGAAACRTCRGRRPGSPRRARCSPARRSRPRARSGR